jgi:hypothetical protein
VRRRRFPIVGRGGGIWLARLFTGAARVSLMTRIRGAANARAKRELGRARIFATWREGFREGLGTAPAPAMRARFGAAAPATR